MRALGLLQNLLERSQVVGHAKRRAALMKAVGSLVSGSGLSVTMLGRGLRSGGHEKHRIKCVDKLLRNGHLHGEREAVYGVLGRWVLRGVDSALIEVDWSDTGRRDVRVLRAAVALCGRAFVLYEATYCEREYNRASVHRAFLNTVHALVPGHCRVIVLSDAGFRASWFRLVESLGWQWVGRVRGTSKYQRVGEVQWEATKELYARAGRGAQALGGVRLNKGDPLDAQFFLSAKPRPRRPGRRRCAQDYRAARSHREPWLLAASPGLRLTARQAMALYGRRMQIEQSFRDLKNPRHGFGLRYSNSTKLERVAILLLIAALASFVQWVVGLAAERAGWTRWFQANTERQRRVLSIVYLGARVLRNRRLRPTRSMLRQAYEALPRLVVTVPAPA